MTRRWLARLVVAALVAATGVLGQAGPAAAALCAAGTGVSVVVDFTSLGGSTVKACGSGDTAAAISAAAGVRLTTAAREPGFVCRVNAKPASDPCVNASPSNAYWGLYWSTGNGSWTYATQGAYSLKVPQGGFVGWAFQDGGANRAPGVTPKAAAAPAPTKPSKPKPKPKPKPGPTSAPQPGPGATAGPKQSAPAEPTQTATTPREASSDGPRASAGAGAAAGTPSDKPRAKPSQRASGSESSGAGDASASGSPSPDEAAQDEAAQDEAAQDDAAEAALEPSSSELDDEPGGLPLWVPAGVLALLAAGSGAAVWWRRRTG